MFEGFQNQKIPVGDSVINLMTGGEGPPLLLLHGYPQTHVAWHAVAPALARDFTLVIPDLPGYGDSLGPEPDPAHLNYAKRTIARTLVGLMEKLGFDRFALAGHDRGGRVAYRMALDHPERVSRLAVLDIIPTLEVWEAMDWQQALDGYHWPFLAQPAPLPERMVGQDPDFYIRHLLDRWIQDGNSLAPEALSQYLRQFHKASVVAATCADYRAGASQDLAHDRADRAAGKRVTCPLLVVWGRGYFLTEESSPAEIWRAWAEEVSEVALDCGHFVAEEQPEACAAALREFFAD
ncbi:alpha/beta fold hydrolase [Denitrobaculum tricleocarpae]|uniref:Alpha/beta hydrolase n=1 Tax=Denitrobaculum tricleocarpae TaxID=2591009 RepID=A0A545TR42_9PROT|nr:alpha/beta hydrolase [Denitrobaculum tricleocarpae]TQV79689.1 alpha/beta hydrolase [Denitrobaculum tricleocarpae]